MSSNEKLSVASNVRGWLVAKKWEEEEERVNN